MHIINKKIVIKKIETTLLGRCALTFFVFPRLPGAVFPSAESDVWIGVSRIRSTVPSDDHPAGTVFGVGARFS